MSSVSTLDERIQALAQELQDIIFDYTVAFEPGVATIDKKWKAPWQLQINRATRAELSKVYYSRTTFRVHMDGGSLFKLTQWVKMIGEKQRKTISDLRADFPWRDEILPVGLDLENVQRMARTSLVFLQDLVGRAGTRLPSCTIKAKMLVYEVNGELKEVWRGLSDWPSFTGPTWVASSRFVIQDVGTDGQRRMRLSQLYQQMSARRHSIATSSEPFPASGRMEEVD